MLLPGGRRHLRLGLSRRAWLALWVALVLAVHLALARHWPGWQTPLPPLPPRLQISFSQALKAQAPQPPAPRPPPPAVPRRLPAAVPGLPAAVDAVAAEPAPSASTPTAAQPLLASPSPALTPAGADEPGPEWPLSTRLRYQLTGDYNGPVHGDASVEWLRQGRNYQMRLRVGIGPSLAPLVQRDLISSGRLGSEGIEPRRYDEETRLLFGTPRRLMVLIDERWVQLADGSQVPSQAGLQDSASQFVQLSWRLLTGRDVARVGQVIEMPLALPRALRPWRYVLAESLEIDTPLGPQPVWHLRPEGVDARGALLAEVWLAPQLQWLPVRIRILQAPHWVELNLADVPLQEAAPARDNAPSQPPTPPPP